MTPNQRAVAGRSKTVVVFFIVFIFLYLLGSIGAQFALRNFFQSATLNTFLQQSVKDFVLKKGSPLQVELPPLEYIGFLDLQLSPIKVTKPLGEPLLLSLNVGVNGFLAGFLGIPLKVKLMLATHLGDNTSGVVLAQNDVTLKDLWSLTKISKPGDLSELSPSLVSGFNVALTRMNVREMLYLLPEGAFFPQAKLKSGEISGDIRFRKEADEVHVNLKWSEAEWESALFDKISIVTAPFTLDGVYRQTAFFLNNPLALKINFELKEGVGGIQNNLLLVGKGGLVNQSWTLTLTEHVTWNKEDIQLALKARVQGGPLALLAAGRLFRCQVPPLREYFEIQGPGSKPRCF